MWTEEGAGAAYAETAKTIQDLYLSQLTNARILGEIAAKTGYDHYPFSLPPLATEWQIGRDNA